MVQLYLSYKKHHFKQFYTNNLSALTFTLCLLLIGSSLSFGQVQMRPTAAPSNDNFESAIAINVSTDGTCSTTGGTTVDATGENYIPYCVTQNVDDDVWYKFIASPGPQKITVTPGNSPLRGPSFQLLTLIGGIKNSVDCVVNENNVNTTAIEKSYPDLIPGNTYYIRVFSKQNSNSRRGNFNICVSSPLCTPAVSGLGNPTKWLTKVQSVGAIYDGIQNSGKSSYTDFISKNISSQIPNQPINLSLGISSDGLSIHIYVDWNKDGIFQVASEMVLTTGGTYMGSTTVGFIVPPTTAAGKYLMRIKTATDSNTDPCLASGGETEDYTITVLDDCSSKITKVFDGERCGPGEVILKVEATAGATSYNWYTAFAGSVDVPFTTTTVPQLVQNITTTTQYRVTSSNGSCESRVKATIRGIVRPIPTITFDPENPVVCGVDNIIKVTANASSNNSVAFEQDFSSNPFGTGSNSFIPATRTGPTTWPTGIWTVQNSTHLVNYTSGWRPAISSGDAGNKFIVVNSNNSSYGSTTMTSTLETRPFSTVGFEDLKLDYRHYFSRNSVPSGIGKVEIRVGTGAWILINENSLDVGLPSNFKGESINLIGYINNPVVRIRFVYSAKWADGWALDDIVVSGNKTTIPNFTWGSGVSAYIDQAASIPYTNQQISTLFIKPSEEQMQNATFTVVAGIAVGAGICEATNTLTVVNKTKIWDPTNAQNNWHDGANWKPAGVPTIENCIIVPSKTATISENIVAYGKNLVIKPTGKVIINANRDLVIKESITSPNSPASGGFVINDNASVRQIDNFPNFGNAIVKRQSEPVRRYDYTYWSSMVANQTLFALSPNTLFDKYYLWNSYNDAWQLIPSGNMVMEAAKGYIIRAPQSYSITNYAPYDASFSGRLNNGDYSQILYANKWALLGNPYPSALSAQEFLLANSSVLEGTIYLWSHNSPPSSAYPGEYVYNYTEHDYATWNLTGGTATAASLDPLVPGISLLNTNVPTGKIASGQGFFVKAVQNGTAKFKNSMRVTSENDQFFRMQLPKKSSSRYWLNLRNDQGAFNQILVGYLREATRGLDWGYDGEVFGGTTLSMYTISENVNLTIQALPLPLDETSYLPLGYKTSIAGELFITLENFEGVFASPNQSVYIKDNLAGQFHNLKSGPYYFTTQIGTYNERFEVHYRPDGPNRYGVAVAQKDAAEILAFKYPNEIVLESRNCIISEIDIIDMQGKVLKKMNNLKTTRQQIRGLIETHQTVIIKSKSTEGEIFTQKIIY